MNHIEKVHLKSAQKVPFYPKITTFNTYLQTARNGRGFVRIYTYSQLHIGCGELKKCGTTQATSKYGVTDCVKLVKTAIFGVFCKMTQLATLATWR